MIPFATEFPVKANTDRAAFLAQVITWLRGTEYSAVLDEQSASDIDGDSAFLSTTTGEELRFRAFAPSGTFRAIGFRHDFPDQDGRLWRTEAVLRRAIAKEGQDLIRLRTQCLAKEPGVRLETPRKPYLVKGLLRDGWGGEDGHLRVKDEPIWLGSDNGALETAAMAKHGKLTQHLPVVYVSAVGAARWLATRDQLDKLAFDLGGVAHVVVEPDVLFSARLKALTSGGNTYGGTFGISVPGRGFVRRFYLGWRLPTLQDLLAAVRESAIAIRSQMPADGWDWTELQEQALRQHRESERSRLTAPEAEQLYLEEIDNLKDRVKQLEDQILSSQILEAPEVEYGIIPPPLLKKMGKEIYPGEFTDRLRYAAKHCLDRADQIGLDARSKNILNAFRVELAPSPGLAEFVEELKRATKDAKRMAIEVTASMMRHGYREKSDNKHVKLEPKEGYPGLGTIVLSKTPSDDRGLKNMRKEIERTLGITGLDG